MVSWSAMSHGSALAAPLAHRAPSSVTRSGAASSSELERFNGRSSPTAVLSGDASPAMFGADQGPSETHSERHSERHPRTAAETGPPGGTAARRGFFDFPTGPRRDAGRPALRLSGDVSAASRRISSGACNAIGRGQGGVAAVGHRKDVRPLREAGGGMSVEARTSESALLRP